MPVGRGNPYPPLITPAIDAVGVGRCPDRRRPAVVGRGQLRMPGQPIPGPAQPERAATAVAQHQPERAWLRLGPGGRDRPGDAEQIDLLGEGVVASQRGAGFGARPARERESEFGLQTSMLSSTATGDASSIVARQVIDWLGCGFAVKPAAGVPVAVTGRNTTCLVRAGAGGAASGQHNQSGGGEKATMMHRTTPDQLGRLPPTDRRRGPGVASVEEKFVTIRTLVPAQPSTPRTEACPLSRLRAMVRRWISSVPS